MRSFLILLMALFCISLAALPLTDAVPEDKALSARTHTAGSIQLDTTNYGFCKDLFYPANSDIKMIYKSGIWVSGKRQRRDELGRRLFWLAHNPSADSAGTVAEFDSLWMPWMNPVIDTLTTVGFDGDKDLYEFLPAYNPLSWENPIYNQYNLNDKVLKSILGTPSPRPFQYPDQQNNYCFSIPQGGTFDTPGFETHSAYYYDFCPFETEGDRDLGISRGTNEHYPLGLAIHQESYAWNLQNHERMIVFKYQIQNTSSVDSLYDVAIAGYVDADVGPSALGGSIATDDKSGYVKGPGYEFAYSYDADLDGGLSTNYIAHKIILLSYSANRHCWYWKVGDGPDDFYPYSFNYSPRRTANEKYWLMTGRNPNETKFAPLRPEQDDIMEYEQPTPNDTRFLDTLYGNLPTDSDPEPDGRLNLEPGEQISFYRVLFTGDNLDDLKARSQMINAFINGGLDLGDVQNLTCIPYLKEIAYPGNGVFHLQWFSYSDPQYFLVMHKPYDSPASQWVHIQLPGTNREYDLAGLDSDTWYQLKVASIYNPGPDEVYLESETYLANLSYPAGSDDIIQPVLEKLRNYPNPFNPGTTIDFELKKSCRVELSLYDVRGRMVRSLYNSVLPIGVHSLFWDGTNRQGTSCSSGIYFLRLSTGSETIIRKMLLLK
jgi:hypothetical protein